jgi:hypothetical protein
MNGIVFLGSRNHPMVGQNSVSSETDFQLGGARMTAAGLVGNPNKFSNIKRHFVKGLLAPRNFLTTESAERKLYLKSITCLSCQVSQLVERPSHGVLPARVT